MTREFYLQRRRRVALALPPTPSLAQPDQRWRRVSRSPARVSAAITRATAPPPPRWVASILTRRAPAVSVTGVTDARALHPWPRAGRHACSTSDALSGVATQATLSTERLAAVSAASPPPAPGDRQRRQQRSAGERQLQRRLSLQRLLEPGRQPADGELREAGRNIPLKWRLTDASGNPITNLASVTVTSMAGGCSAERSGRRLEEYARHHLGLAEPGRWLLPVQLEDREELGRQLPHAQARLRRWASRHRPVPVLLGPLGAGQRLPCARQGRESGSAISSTYVGQQQSHQRMKTR